MTRNEIEERIKDLSERVFFINMADFLSSDDWAYIRKYEGEIRDLRGRLARGDYAAGDE